LIYEAQEMIKIFNYFALKAFSYVLIGILIMIGMRVIEYTIEKPPVQIIICYVEPGKAEDCSIYKSGDKQ